MSVPSKTVNPFSISYKPMLFALTRNSTFGYSLCYQKNRSRELYSPRSCFVIDGNMLSVDIYVIQILRLFQLYIIKIIIKSEDNFARRKLARHFIADLCIK